MSKTTPDFLDYDFTDKALFERALTHSSAGIGKDSYERLEFLGDRILGFVVAEMLYTQFTAEEEGALAKRQSALVKQSALELVAEKIGLRSFIRTSSGEALVTGSMLADVIEALIAALYLDGGLEVARSFIKKHWLAMLSAPLAPPEEGKSALQEWAQARGMNLPEYKIVERTGPDHQPHFIVEVGLGDFALQRGEGRTKQEAERAAAIKMLQTVREHKE